MGIGGEPRADPLTGQREACPMSLLHRHSAVGSTHGKEDKDGGSSRDQDTISVPCPLDVICRFRPPTHLFSQAQAVAGVAPLDALSMVGYLFQTGPDGDYRLGRMPLYEMK